MRVFIRPDWDVDSTMKCTRLIPEQIIHKLKMADQLIFQDNTATDVYRVLEVAQPT
jgi:hypothetical protein